MRHDDSSDDDDCKPEHGDEKGKSASAKRPYATSWWTPAWLRLGDERQVALQERIFRDHQRQLDDVSKQVASGSYTPQSLVSELWTFWSRVVGDQADMIRVAAGLKTASRGEKVPRVYAFSSRCAWNPTSCRPTARSRSTLPRCAPPTTGGRSRAI